MRVIAGKADGLNSKLYPEMRHDQQQTVLKKLFLIFSSLKYRIVAFLIFSAEAEESVLKL